LKENEESVVLTQEDMRNVREFFNHFNIDMPEYLDKTILSVEKENEITLQSQKNFKTSLVRAISESNHELFKDSLFEEIVPECEKEWYEAQFSQDFEAAMSSQDQKK
jgi:uncharacterized protein (DUF1786 family)